MKSALHVDVLTIFPELFDTFLTRGMVGRARQLGQLSVTCTDLRGFTSDSYRSIDDRPYGGGPGMVIKPEPVLRAIDLLVGSQDSAEAEGIEFVLFDPSGERLAQPELERWSKLEGVYRLVLACGRYEGFDARILEARPWRRVSIGEYVLSGGELPAMVLIDGVSRLLPGVLGDAESAVRESFSEWAGPDGVDHPQWTRPETYRGLSVPDVLKSGNHGRIEEWRREQMRAAKRDDKRGDESRRSEI